MSQIDSFKENSSNQSLSCASLVIEHQVALGKEKEFENWQKLLTSAVSDFKGYLRTDTSPPVKGVQNKWYVIVYFDKLEDLNEWVNSPQRLELVKKGEELFGSFKSRNLKTGLESWFTSQTEPYEMKTPAWKQNLIVILGLYPTVMLQTLIFSALGLMKSWPMSASMLISNIVCSSLLTWVVMPPLSRWFNFWLKNQEDNSRGLNARGLAIILVSLLALMGIFYTISDSDRQTVGQTLQTYLNRFF